MRADESIRNLNLAIYKLNIEWHDTNIAIISKIRKRRIWGADNVSRMRCYLIYRTCANEDFIFRWHMLIRNVIFY